MRKINAAAVLLALALMLCGCDTAAGNSHNGIVVTDSLAGKTALVGDIACEFPLTTGNTTLNILTVAYDGIAPEDVYVWSKYRQMTGVNVNWTGVARDRRSEVVNTALTNGQDLDLIMRCKLSATRLTRYGESGLIIDLAKDGLLERCAPNCWAYLQSHPETLASITNPDGTIYALPQVNSGAELRVGLKLFVNKRWLENLDLQLPATTEEFYDMLLAFKNHDANGNGDPDDEIPFSSADWSSVQESLYGAFGLENRGMHNAAVDSDPKTGKVRFIEASPEYKDFLEYAGRLYSEKLLDNNIFTITEQQWINNIKNDTVGVFARTNLAWVPADRIDDWVGIEQALEGPNGDKLWSPIRANFHSTGAAVIPTTCSDPELVLKWLDYFWTDEGTLFYHMGIQGETFVVTGDGGYDYAGKIYDEISAGNKSFDDVVAGYSPYPGGSNPTVEIAPYFMGGEMAEVPAKTAMALFEYGPEEYWPGFTFTSEENDRLSTLQSDLNKYLDIAQPAFVMGKTPLTEWDSYLRQLDNLKVGELVAIYQSAVDRYEAGKTAQ